MLEFLTTLSHNWWVNLATWIVCVIVFISIKPKTPGMLILWLFLVTLLVISAVSVFNLS